jgi:hypothetical protein
VKEQARQSPRTVVRGAEAQLKQTLRLRLVVALPVVAVLSLGAKFYPGPGRWWVNNYGPASVGYEIFFMLLVFLIVPRPSAITPIAVGVCAATCVLEGLQLWQPPWLKTIRSTFLGGALLGGSFSWWDFPAYPAGCLLGWLLLRRLVGWSDSEVRGQGA